MRSSKLGWLAAIGLAAVVAACGGGGGDDAPAAVIANDVVAKASPTTALGVSGSTFSFAPIPQLGTTGTTTIKVDVPVVGSGSTASLGSPTFNIASGGRSAKGRLGFGSCIFQITESDFDVVRDANNNPIFFSSTADDSIVVTSTTTGAVTKAHPLSVGKQVTVDPCTFEFNTAGTDVTSTTDANGNEVQTDWTIGNSKSNPVPIPVRYDATTGSVLVVLPPQVANLLANNTTLLNQLQSPTGSSIGQTTTTFVTGGV